MIELLFLGAGAFAGGAHAVRQSRTRHQPYRQPRPVRQHSLLVKAWNSAGAPHTEETMLGDALADLGGRAIGRTYRRTAPRVRDRRQKIRSGAERRWQRRLQEDRTVTFFRRRNRGTGSKTGQPDGAAPYTASRRTGTVRTIAVPRTTPMSIPARDAADAPPLPPGARPNVPRSPIPMPPGPAGASTGRTSRRAASRGRSPGGGRSPARRRARSRMRVAVPLNLDAPHTDVEFLDACADLQQMLRGIGVAVQDWTDELTVRRLPTLVTGPLEQVHEGLVDGAACTALATSLFENWFAEAREIAAAGIEFTGDDPE
ncbi:hypothetical protein [Spirillospora sp. NPDC029432]|uniref:hypothetical protein n=1 Tax=Spirillospora sp. NPDC029432 TaxID=3154599 RepID=UPI0034526413